MKISLCGSFADRFPLLVAIPLILAIWTVAPAQQQPPSKTGSVGQTKAAEEAEKAAQDEGKIKVVFDEKRPGIVYVESNGEKIRVDTTKRTVEQLVASDKSGEQPATN